MIWNPIQSCEGEKEHLGAVILNRFPFDNGCLEFVYGEAIFEYFRERVGKREFNSYSSRRNVLSESAKIHFTALPAIPSPLVSP